MKEEINKHIVNHTNQHLLDQIDRYIARELDLCTIKDACGISNEMLAYILEMKRLKSEVDERKKFDDILVYASNNCGKSTVHYITEIDKLNSKISELESENLSCKRMIKRREESILRLNEKVKKLANVGDAMRDEISKHLIYNHGLKMMHEWHSAKDENQSK